MVKDIKGTEINTKEFIDHQIGEGETIEITVVVESKETIIFRRTVPTGKYLRIQAEWHEKEVIL